MNRLWYLGKIKVLDMGVKLNEKSVIIILLLVIDFIFIFLTIGRSVIDDIFPWYNGFLLNSNWSIENDNSYAEMFQYAKESIIATMFFLLFVRKQYVICLAFGLVFGYLLLDDALQLHERLGILTAIYFDYFPILGVQAADLGEITISAVAAFFLLSFVGISHYLSDNFLRKVSRNTFLLLIALGIFGIVIDMIHLAMSQCRYWNRILGTVEDGGEMLIMTIIVWYIFALFQDHFIENENSEELAEVSISC